MKKVGQKKTDFIWAKEISAFEVHQNVTFKPETTGNFRKYLRDFTRHTPKIFVTKIIAGELYVVRIK